MRQRIPPRSTNRQGSGVWDKSSDTDTESSVTSPHQPVPMFNPQHYQASSSGHFQQHAPSPPGSVPMSWHRNSYHKTSDLLPALPGGTQSLEGLKSIQLPSLSPAFIPDANYQTYLRTGQSVFRSKQQGIGISMTRICCAKFCAVFSWIAVTFLVMVGLLYDTQPLYLRGALPRHEQYQDGSTSKVQVFYALSGHQRLTPASNAYQAAGVYFVTGCLCWAYAYNAHYYVFSRWRHYQDIPDTDSTVPTFHLNTHDAAELPSTTSPGRRRAYPTYNATISTKDRIIEIVRGTYNRIRIHAATVWPGNQEHRWARRREAGPKNV